MRSVSRDCAPLYPKETSERTILNGLLGHTGALDGMRKAAEEESIVVFPPADDEAA